MSFSPTEIWVYVHCTVYDCTLVQYCTFQYKENESFKNIEQYNTHTVLYIAVYCIYCTTKIKRIKAKLHLTHTYDCCLFYVSLMGNYVSPVKSCVTS